MNFRSLVIISLLIQAIMKGLEIFCKISRSIMTAIYRKFLKIVLNFFKKQRHCAASFLSALKMT